MKKDGRRLRRQRYKCQKCGYVFESKRRNVHGREKSIWRQYCYNRKTYAQIARETKRSSRWVQAKIDSAAAEKSVIESGETVLVMDTTYFGRGFGVMVFRCAWRRKNISWHFVEYETVWAYVEGVRKLEEAGWKIRGIVCDGRNGLFTAFGDIPIQMCHFHQTQIVTRYITRRPKLPAGKELRQLTLLLKETDEASFSFWLEDWHLRWKDFLNERTYDTNGKYWYVHKRLRSAYRSLKTHLPYLFTFERNLSLNIPNTTNSLDGTFAHVKERIRLHRGLKKHRRDKLLEQLLSSTTQPHTFFH